jgi:hypothetical protein
VAEPIGSSQYVETDAQAQELRREGITPIRFANIPASLTRRIFGKSQACAQRLDIAAHDPHFAVTYIREMEFIREMELLLPLLTDGSPSLYARAAALLADYAANKGR